MVFVKCECWTEPDGGVSANSKMNSVTPHQADNLLPPVCGVTVHRTKCAPAPDVAEDSWILGTQIHQTFHHLVPNLCYSCQ